MCIRDSFEAPGLRRLLWMQHIGAARRRVALGLARDDALAADLVEEVHVPIGLEPDLEIAHHVFIAAVFLEHPGANICGACRGGAGESGEDDGDGVAHGWESSPREGTLRAHAITVG